MCSQLSPIVRALTGVLMVTRDPEAVRLAKCYGARVLIEEKNAGHTAASSFGAKTLAAEGVAGMIQIPGDLPAITPDDVETVLAVHGDAPAVTIVPSSDELGSNAVACSPPDLLPLRFGDNSFVPHVESARKLGIEARDRQAGGHRPRYRHAGRSSHVPGGSHRRRHLKLSPGERHCGAP